MLGVRQSSAPTDVKVAHTQAPLSVQPPRRTDTQPSPPAPRHMPPGPEAKGGWLSPAAVFSAVVVALLCIGLRVPTERYITPKRGVGYDAFLGLVTLVRSGVSSSLVFDWRTWGAYFASTVVNFLSAA